MKAVAAPDAMEFTFPVLSPAYAVFIAAIFSLPLYIAGGMVLKTVTAWNLLYYFAVLSFFLCCAFFIHRWGKGRLTVTPAEITYRSGGHVFALPRYAVTKFAIISHEEFKAMPGPVWLYYLAGTPLAPVREDPHRRICVAGSAGRYLVIETRDVTLIFAISAKNAVFSRFAEGLALKG